MPPSTHLEAAGGKSKGSELSPRGMQRGKGWQPRGRSSIFLQAVVSSFQQTEANTTTLPHVHFQMSLLPPTLSVLPFSPVVFFFIIHFNLLLTKAEILQSRAAGIKKSSKQINQTQNIWATWPNPGLLPISQQCQSHLSVWSITLLLSPFDKGAPGLLAGQERARK